MLFTILYRIKEKEKEVLLLGSTIVINACVFYFLANNKPSNIVRCFEFFTRFLPGLVAPNPNSARRELLTTYGILRNLRNSIVLSKIDKSYNMTNRFFYRDLLCVMIL